MFVCVWCVCVCGVCGVCVCVCGVCVCVCGVCVCVVCVCGVCGVCVWCVWCVCVVFVVYVCMCVVCVCGVWCVCVCGVCVQCMCVCSVLPDSLQPHGLYPPASSVHGIFQARILELVVFSSPRDLPDPGIKLQSPALQADSLLSEPLVFINYHFYPLILFLPFKLSPKQQKLH